MSEVDAMLKRYQEIKERLRNPPNAVPDPGIDLSRPKGVKGTTQPPEVQGPPRIVPALSLPPPRYLTLQSTFEISAEELGVDSKLLKNRSRKKNASFPRQVAIYVAAKLNRWPRQWIARYVSLDHATVYYAESKIGAMIETDGDLRNKVETIARRLSLLPTSALPPDNKPHLGQGTQGDVPKSILPEVD